MEIRRVPVSKLNPAAYNPRRDLRPGDRAYRKLSRSLDKFGCVEPVVWNVRNGNVVGGHQRLKILMAAGETELDVSVVHLSEADEKALNIALNKIEGEWDAAALTGLLEELSAASGIDETLTGFDRGELDSLLAELEERDRGLESAVAAPYVDSFFESGVQAKEPPKSQAPVPTPAGREEDPGDSTWSVTVYGLFPEGLEALTAYLEDRGLAYRTEQNGGGA